MWTRSLLKQNAKEALRGRYWRSMLLCLVLSLFGIGGVTTQFRTVYDVTTDELDDMLHGSVWYGNEAQSLDLSDLFGYNYLWFLQIFAVVTLLVFIVALCWYFFVLQPLVVGRNRYFMESRQAPSPWQTVLTVFRKPYLNVVKVYALTFLKIFLGSLLIIPGIYWSFCYRMVPYLLAENPYLTTGRAMELSHAMMMGEKWRSFVLDLSFFGWLILCTLTFGIGLFFLEPYYQATMAELYAALRSKAFALNLTDETELCGFVRHDSHF